MSRPTAAERSVRIDAPAERVYDLVADVTRMGEWSPECVRCEWLDEPGRVGSRFRGHNRQGLARWRTVAQVVAADRPREFGFATLYRGKPSTRWTYRFEEDGDDQGGVTVTESFDAVAVPWLVGVAERLVVRNRQAQLEAGMAETLQRIKAAAEG